MNEIAALLNGSYTPFMQILEVRHLLLVATVADEGNLTRAGERLNLTQSALSHQLLDIEERLGTPLFHRVTRRMTLTEAGERVLESARRILDDLSRTEEDLRLYASNRRGVIRLTTECYTVYHWLPTVMKQFGERYPGIEIRIEVDATDRPFDALRRGEIDVAFVTSDQEEPGIEMLPLFDDEMLLIVGADHRLATRDHVRVAELADETLLTYGSLKDSLLYQRMMRPAGIEPKKHMCVKLTEVMIELAKANVGVAALARWAVAPFLESGTVAGVKITRTGFARHWKAARSATRPMLPYLKAFIESVAREGPEALQEVPRLHRVVTG